MTAQAHTAALTIEPTETDLGCDEAIMLSFELESVQWAVSDAVRVAVDAESAE